MKRVREEDEKDPSQWTLYTCVKHMNHRKWLREEFAGFPLELFENVIMEILAPHAASLLAFAMTCKRLYHGPWRSLYGHTLEIGEYNKEKWGKGRFKKGEVFSQGALDLFAPFLKKLTYYLPCHHEWEPWDLKPCTMLEELTFIGNECYSGRWRTPLPVSLRTITLENYRESDINWCHAFENSVGRTVECHYCEYDCASGKQRVIKINVTLKMIFGVHVMETTTTL